jgi:hypothetical protein
MFNIAWSSDNEDYTIDKRFQLKEHSNILQI